VVSCLAGGQPRSAPSANGPLLCPAGEGPAWAVVRAGSPDQSGGRRRGHDRSPALVARPLGLPAPPAARRSPLPRVGTEEPLYPWPPSPPGRGLTSRVCAPGADPAHEPMTTAASAHLFGRGSPTHDPSDQASRAAAAWPASSRERGLRRRIAPRLVVVPRADHPRLSGLRLVRGARRGTPWSLPAECALVLRPVDVLIRQRARPAGRAGLVRGVARPPGLCVVRLARPLPSREAWPLAIPTPCRLVRPGPARRGEGTRRETCPGPARCGHRRLARCGPPGPGRWCEATRPERCLLGWHPVFDGNASGDPRFAQRSLVAEACPGQTPTGARLRVPLALVPLAFRPPARRPRPGSGAVAACSGMLPVSPSSAGPALCPPGRYLAGL
jgi:hypothetical protein